MVTKATKKEPEPLWARPLLKMQSMRHTVHRPGALEVLAMPSRMGGTLFYPDGRKVKDEVKS
jgi:hypothetical protein